MDQMHNQGHRGKRFEGISKEQKIHKHGWSRGPGGREIKNNTRQAGCCQIAEVSACRDEELKSLPSGNKVGAATVLLGGHLFLLPFPEDSNFIWVASHLT